MSEDPHERELDEIEAEIKELESADETRKKPEEPIKAEPEETSKEAGTYEEKSKEEWKHNDKKPESRLSYNEEEIEVIEEDL